MACIISYTNHKKSSHLQLGSLIQSAMGESSCSAEEYVAGEDAISLCVLTLIVKTGMRIG